MKHPVTCLALLTDAFGGFGGIAQYNRDLVTALAAMPDIGDVEVLALHEPAPPGPLPARVRQHPAAPGRIGYALAAWRAGRRSRPDLVFCGHLHLAPLAAVIAWRARARLVVQTHGVEAWARPSRLRRRAVEAADLVLAVSRDTRARVLTWARLDPERIRVAPNTVADDYAPADATEMRRDLGLEGCSVILTVGRLAAAEGYKGHDRVIAALPALVDAGENVIYLVAGDGDDQPRLERLAAEAGVANRVRFLGRVPRERLPDLYRAADLFVLASSGEGFGIVLLEAMACGTPALGFSVGGAVDALGDGVLGCAAEPAHFALALANALTGLPRDPDLAAKVRARFGRPVFEARVHRVLAPLVATREAG